MILKINYRMLIFVTLIASISDTMFLKTSACIYKHEEPLHNPWDMQVFPRKLHEFKTCECGVDATRGNHPYYKDWYMVIHLFNSYPDSFSHSCMGTVVNNKMILTSHNCLRMTNGTIGHYDTWNLQPSTSGSTNVLASKENIRFSWYEDPTEALKTFVAEEIIYNQDWISSAMNKYQPDDDLVILVINANLSIEYFPPICVPQWDDQYDPTGLTGYYYGIGGEFPTDPNPAVRSTGGTFVLPGKTCDSYNRMPGFSSNETLCVQSRLMSPKTTGGPLIMSEDGVVNSEGYTPGKTVFLLGLSSAIKQRREDDLIVTTWFSSIFRWIRYLEYHAFRVNATWCNSSRFQLDTTFRNTDFKKELKKRYIWDVDSPVQRDESLDCVCGLHNYEKTAQQSRIIGGEPADPHEFPWITYLHVLYKANVGERDEVTSFECGGSIINNMLILTAAHCVIMKERLKDHESNELDADRVDVYYSIDNLSDDTDGQKVVAKRVYYYRDYVRGIHEEYIDFDIALLELEKPLQFSSAKMHGEAQPKDVRPICLPRKENPIVVVGRNATVAGWGLVPDPMNSSVLIPSEKLLKLQIPILPLESCDFKGDELIRDTVLCAGYFNRSRDASEGDSGGPLAIRSENGYWTQVGVVSYGREYNLTNDPLDGSIPDPNRDLYSHTVSLYANVQKFLGFIDYHSKKVGAKWCKSYI